MRKLFTIFIAFLAACASPQAALAADMVYVMRHLQKGEGADPPLSAEGAANAKALADKLAGSGIKAIFATPTRRAMETAEPLAKRLGIAIAAYDPADPGALVAAVANVPGAVLVVGHSNTVPDLVARFGGKQAVTMSEQDYGTVYAVAEDSGAVTEIVLTPTS
jgi:broad specificity phosphatase PhoE